MTPRQHEKTARGYIAVAVGARLTIAASISAPAGDMRGAVRAMTSLRRLDELRVDARYHRERRDLYRAKIVGPRPTSLVQLKELERACVLSEARLRRAEQEQEAEKVRLEARQLSDETRLLITRPGS